MKNAFKKMWRGGHSTVGAYVFYVMSAIALVFVRSAKWAYEWIEEIYPLHEKFIPTLKGVIITTIVLNALYVLYCAITKDKSVRSKKAVDICGSVLAVISVIQFVYGMVLTFGFDTGVRAEAIMDGIYYMGFDSAMLTALVAAPLACIFAETSKKILRSAVAAVTAAAIIIIPAKLIPPIDERKSDVPVYDNIAFTSNNIITKENAVIEDEMLKKRELSDAANLLEDNDACWTPQSPNRKPAEGYYDINNSYVDIKFNSPQTFNTAVIEEVGNEVQYFRIQAKVDGEWKTVYQSEKIQKLRLCSFDTVTTDCVRLSIDKFRNASTPARIKSFKLYNEGKRDAKDFEVTVYQRLDGNPPTEILARGEEYAKNYAKFYDVYSTVIVFSSILWDENGKMTFGNLSEEEYAAEINALKQVVDMRSNKEHKVKIIVTALSDGVWQDVGVNGYMHQHWEGVADQIVEFVKKYDVDGVDIDWEYPANEDDWALFDKFIARLDNGMNEHNEGKILTAALSAWGLGMSTETLNRFDQIQFMAYDGCDADGYQSSLHQAESGLIDFVKNGADISKINIGIAAYGRPVNGSPYWATWCDLKQANYWDSKYYNVPDAGQVYDGTFCSPATAGDKTAYALMSGVGGVMVFRLNCDKTMDDPNSVACGIENALNRYVNNW